MVKAKQSATQLTVSQLGERGYRVNLAANAVDCTDVSSEKPFWFINPRFMDISTSPEGVLSFVEMARRENDQYVLTVAGIHEGDNLFPFVLLNYDQFQALRIAQARVQGALEAYELAKNQYQAAGGALREFFAM